jgi:hypothetical protein
VEALLKGFSISPNPPELLSLLANNLGTLLIEIRSAEDLKKVVQDYLARGEKVFANLENELDQGVLGITFRLIHPLKYELPYVSVIDSRGGRSRRAYFTKWHELGHLLVLTDQSRLQFTRTHSLHQPKSPEESLIDVLAGEFAYYASMVQPLANGEISFEKIEAIRDELCPNGSFTSAIIGIAKAWPSACLLVEAALARKKSDGHPNQVAMNFIGHSPETLRAIHVTPNEMARRRGIRIHLNFRVPASSVIAKVFKEELTSGEAFENLSWWRSSDGTQMKNLSIFVQARRIGASVFAVVIPADRP